MSSTGVHLRPLGADELEDASREDGELSTTSGSTPASAFASESDWSDADEEDWERCSQTSAGTGRSVAPSPVIVAAVPPSQPAAVTTTAAAAAPRLHSMQPLNMIQTRHVPALQASSLIRAPLPQAYRHVLKGLTEMRAHLQVGIPAISAAKLTAINPYASAPQTPLPPPTSKAELLAGKAKRRAKLQSCISAADASVALVHFHLTRAQEAMR
jgi:hypothetical protein